MLRRCTDPVTQQVSADTCGSADRYTGSRACNAAGRNNTIGGEPKEADDQVVAGPHQ